jgi:hypothetical protein
VAIDNSYDELVNEHQVTFIAGGAAQNTGSEQIHILYIDLIVITSVSISFLRNQWCTRALSATMTLLTS